MNKSHTSQTTPMGVRNNNYYTKSNPVKNLRSSYATPNQDIEYAYLPQRASEKFIGVRNSQVQYEDAGSASITNSMNDLKDSI